MSDEYAELIERLRTNLPGDLPREAANAIEALVKRRNGHDQRIVQAFDGLVTDRDSWKALAEAAEAKADDLLSVARRVWLKYGHDESGLESDWNAWHDLGDAILGRDDAQPYTRHQIETRAALAAPSTEAEG